MSAEAAYRDTHLHGHVSAHSPPRRARASRRPQRLQLVRLDGPPTARAADALPPEYRIEIPDGYDVQSVDYDASYVGLTGGAEGTATTKVGGRGVVAVYALQRATGDRVVLVYDNIEQRPTPSAIIHLDAPGTGR